MPNCFCRKRPLHRKIVVLGDGACGKTSLLNVFTRGYFPEIYAPTVFENYVHETHIDNQTLELSLWDTAGQEEFDRLRALSYSDTFVIMACFAVDSLSSLENISARWIKEITDNCEGVQVVLVALKCDLRGGEEKCITYEEGLACASRINAARYLECSAKENKGVGEAFSEV
ncbi:GTP-binding protein rho3 [Neolecta irregularis DAH-3]|uniref:GTP-binding protein RHO3 n=1 Tax=Neolecta irregularis (strain DAH-3) TaxID=1198029 RepID=A0A1U7LHS1_NEOID|nr:GTP-binding protein rho3 [Neolecta irregularis DAH-3]|eukprot:OLL22143.1 GTP-binding protein rho3 [Neolecta irregularis DAH-3]